MSAGILVTGGAGFIGSNFILQWLRRGGAPVINLDKLSYAGNRRNLDEVSSDAARYAFVHGDIGNRELVRGLLERYRPRFIVNFAAETHVDRSIVHADAFMATNVNGTFALLGEVLGYWRSLDLSDAVQFRFLHVSTDEVYGSLAAGDPPFTEQSPFAPNSVYAASKAASDHLVRAYYRTYGLPTLTTHCSNNYGPFQFPEKLVPLMIHNALARKPLPIYGDGQNIRDWLYVEDHCSAIRLILANGGVGETYNIGSGTQITNLVVVETICRILEELRPDAFPHLELITFVKDRLGHDKRYAIDATKVRQEFRWEPSESFESGMRKTILWYIEHQAWVRRALSSINSQGEERLIRVPPVIQK